MHSVFKRLVSTEYTHVSSHVDVNVVILDVYEHETLIKEIIYH